MDIGLVPFVGTVKGMPRPMEGAEITRLSAEMIFELRAAQAAFYRMKYPFKCKSCGLESRRYIGSPCSVCREEQRLGLV